MALRFSLGTGAVLLFPYLPPGTVSNDFYNRYSMLKTLEDIFEVSYLDYDGQPGILPFFGCGSSLMSLGGSASHCQNH